MNCYCGSGLGYDQCCSPLILGQRKPNTPEELMRSRYSAYCVAQADYLVATTHPKTRKHHKKSDILCWAKKNKWIRLEVLQAQANIVAFKAYYFDSKGQAHVHFERSRFLKEVDQWYYLDGVFTE